MTKQQMIDELTAKVAQLEAEIAALHAKHSRKGRAGRKPIAGTTPLTGAERAARYRERKKKSNENENSD